VHENKTKSYGMVRKIYQINSEGQNLPPAEAPRGSKVMASAEAERTIMHGISRRWINHSFAAKLWKYGLAFASIRSRFFEKNLSSSPKDLSHGSSNGFSKVVHNQRLSCAIDSHQLCLSTEVIFLFVIFFFKKKVILSGRPKVKSENHATRFSARGSNTCWAIVR